MAINSQVPGGQGTIIRSHPVIAYFVLTFAISWIGALAVAAPHLIGRQPLPKITGILMFPVMLLGPSVVGISMTRIVDGETGLRALFSQMFRARVSAGWYAALLIPPILVLAVLPVPGKMDFSSVCSKLVFGGHPIWYSRWLLGRNRLDRLRIPENAF